MRSIRKIVTIVCLALALTLVTFWISLGTTSTNALADSSSKVTSTENLSKKFALVLQEEYEGGVRAEITNGCNMDTI